MLSIPIRIDQSTESRGTSLDVKPRLQHDMASFPPSLLMIFPYLYGVSLGVVIIAVLKLRLFFWPIAGVTDQLLHFEWSYWVGIGGALDAFAFVIFSPLPTMRAWHDTVALGMLLGGLGCLAFGVGSVPYLVAVTCAIISIPVCIYWYAVFARHPWVYVSEALKASWPVIKTNMSRGIFPDTSTWLKSFRHFIVCLVVNWTLFFFFKDSLSFFVLFFGVLFEVSLSRYVFGHRTAKSDFANVFAGLIPFMEATCGGTCSFFNLNGTPYDKRLIAAASGLVFSEVIAMIALCFSSFRDVHSKTAKGTGTLAKVILVLLVYIDSTASTPLNLCRILFVSGNLYVFVLDIVTILSKPNSVDTNPS